MNTQPGTVVGNYSLRTLLGRGGQGEVWEADGPDGLVALKLLLKRSPELVLRAWREGRLQRRVKSPHVVGVIDIFLYEDVPVLVMELVPGLSLKDLLRNGHPNLEQTAVIAEGLFAAVAAAHGQGLLHRDLKPANVLLAQTDDALVVKLTDFGVAREQEAWSRGSPMTLHGMVLGTPGFIAPEQVASGRAPDARTDIFSLGALLYSLVTGEKAFKGPSPVAILAASVDGSYTPVHTLRPDAKPEWAEAIAWALRPKPADRAPTVDALRAVWSGLRDSPSRDVTEDPEETSLVQPPSLYTDTLGRPSHKRELVGRAPALLEVRGLLDAHPVVTIWGAPGVGKSHLAEELVRRTSAERPRIAQLTEVQEASGVSAAIAHALEVPLAGSDARERVLAALRASKPGVLLIDNAEHVIDEVRGLLDDATASGTHTRFLVTSRRALGASGEYVYAIDVLSPEDASTLFCQTAERAGSTIRFDDPSLPDILETVGRNPLAIVLAASHLRDRPLSQVAVELDERTLTGNQRFNPMAAALEWSWDLLSPLEKHVLAQCSIFVGGFTLDAATAVIDLSDWPDPPAVVDVLSSLASQALIGTTTDGSGRPRLQLHSTVARHAAAKLRAPYGFGLEVPGRPTGPEAVKSLRNRHARWFARFGDSALRAWRRTESGMADAHALQEETQNLASAIEHAIDVHMDDSVAALGRALADAVNVRGPMLEGAALLGQALTVRVPVRDQIRLLIDQGGLLHAAGKKAAAERQFHRALALAETSDAKRFAAHATLHLANFAYEAGDLQRARELAEDVLTRLDRDEGNPTVISALRTLGCSLQYLGDLDGSHEAFGESLQLARTWEYPIDAALAHLHLGSLAKTRANPHDARKHYLESLYGAQRTGRRQLEARMNTNLGLLEDEEGNPEQALAYLRRSLELCRELGSTHHEALAAGNLGGLLVRLGQLEEAEPLLRSAIDMTEGNWKVAEGAFRANLAHLMAKQGELDPAFDLLDEAEQLVREAHVETWMGVLALRAELALDIGRSGLAQQQVETLKTVFEEHGRPNDLLRLRKRMPSTLLELVERVFST